MARAKKFKAVVYRQFRDKTTHEDRFPGDVIEATKSRLEELEGFACCPDLVNTECTAESDASEASEADDGEKADSE